MLQDGKIFVGKSVKPEYLDLRLANRHGLVTGATGTGKTVTLQVLAEGFSDAGVPVFAADIKGDLSGIAAKGEAKDFLLKRAAEVGLTDYEQQAYPAMFWDLNPKDNAPGVVAGHPIRATVADMGPLLLARLLELNEVQEGVLNIAFRVAADEKLALVDLKDLRAMVNSVGQRAPELTTKYGNVAPASVGAIQRRLLVIEEQGGQQFFGEPALDIKDFMGTGPDGRGMVNILAAEKLGKSPRVYAIFLLWLLTQLFDKLPEVGDPDKPKLVFFFDEAHLLFDEAPKALLAQIERVTRLIRSKGVGVYYITQNPLDVPDTVSAQLGNRVQHALRAFTPREQKAVKAAASTFRKNPQLDTERAIMELKVGEALVSMLESKGEPSIVQRTLIAPPQGRIGPLTPEERTKLVENSPVYGKYEDAQDRESASEILGRRAQDQQTADARANQEREAQANSWGNVIFGRGPRGGRSLGEQVARDVGRSMMRSAVTQVRNAIFRSIFGGRR